MSERTLILLRHAKSDWSGEEPDIDRPLAKRGRRQAPDTGRWLARSIHGIDLAVVSPAVRTRKTWDLVCKELVFFWHDLAADTVELIAVMRQNLQGAELPGSLDEVFAATVNDTDPFPLPAVAPGKVIQGAPLVAVHAHPLGAVTLNDPEPPVAAIGEGTLVGLSE